MLVSPSMKSKFQKHIQYTKDLSKSSPNLTKQSIVRPSKLTKLNVTPEIIVETEVDKNTVNG